MENIQSFEEFLAISSSNVPLSNFFKNMLLTAIFDSLLRWMYIVYGVSISNRRIFAKNFVIISLATMLIITIVKSSLALSLGLVGALSIVRFRAAIKEPEELSYLFLAIAIGLGFGANQSILTFVGFILIALVIILNHFFATKSLFGSLSEKPNIYVQISSEDKDSISLEKIASVLKKFCNAVDLKRLDETNRLFEASFLVEFDGYEKLDATKKALQEIDESITFSFIDYNQPL